MAEIALKSNELVRKDTVLAIQKDKGDQAGL